MFVVTLKITIIYGFIFTRTGSEVAMRTTRGSASPPHLPPLQCRRKPRGYKHKCKSICRFCPRTSQAVQSNHSVIDPATLGGGGPPSGHSLCVLSHSLQVVQTRTPTCHIGRTRGCSCLGKQISVDIPSH